MASFRDFKDGPKADDFTRGMIAAAQICLSMHGDEHCAFEICRAAGAHALDLTSIDENDRDVVVAYVRDRESRETYYQRLRQRPRAGD